MSCLEYENLNVFEVKTVRSAKKLVISKIEPLTFKQNPIVDLINYNLGI